MVVRTRTTGALIVFSMVLVGISVLQAYGEISPYFVSGYSAERRFLAIVNDEYRPGGSLWSKEMFLRDCQDVSRTFYAMAQPTRKRQTFLQKCYDRAAAITTTMPAYSRAWLVQASAAAEMGLPTFLSALRLASWTSPNAHWAAERRTDLAERYFDRLEPSDLVAFENDLRTLLDSESGTRVLARRYVVAPETRQRVSKVVSTSPPALQSRFINTLELEMDSARR